MLRRTANRQGERLKFLRHSRLEAAGYREMKLIDRGARCVVRKDDDAFECEEPDQNTRYEHCRIPQYRQV